MHKNKIVRLNECADNYMYKRMYRLLSIHGAQGSLSTELERRLHINSHDILIFSHTWEIFGGEKKLTNSAV